MGMTVKYTPPKRNLGALVRAAKPIATHAGAEHLLTASDPLVPEDTGTLKASGKVTQDGDRAVVSYSAVAEDGYDYSAIQHERLDFHHEHGQAKYLEAPMHSEAEAIGVVMAVELRRALAL